MAVGKNRRRKKVLQFYREELELLGLLDPRQYRLRQQQLFDRWTGEAIAYLREGDVARFLKVISRVESQLGEVYAAEFKRYAAEASKAPAARRPERDAPRTGATRRC